GLIAGCILLVMGTAASVYAFGIWGQHNFGSLNPAETMPIVIPGVTCLALGIQAIFSSFFLSILGLKR
ncbi:MAG: glycosyltransferase family 2 protein, partial [Waterburya sp.]